jgi:hypothetical protein
MKAVEGRGWTWAALATGLLLLAAWVPTWGFSHFLSPVAFALNVVAWRRSRHDDLFWVGFALNGLLVLALAGEIVSILIGETTFGFE